MRRLAACMEELRALLMNHHSWKEINCFLVDVTQDLIGYLSKTNLRYRMAAAESPSILPNFLVHLSKDMK